QLAAGQRTWRLESNPRISTRKLQIAPAGVSPGTLEIPAAAKREPGRAKPQGTKREPGRAKPQGAKREPGRAKPQGAKREPGRAKPQGKMNSGPGNCLGKSIVISSSLRR